MTIIRHCMRVENGRRCLLREDHLDGHEYGDVFNALPPAKEEWERRFEPEKVAEALRSSQSAVEVKWCPTCGQRVET